MIPGRIIRLFNLIFLLKYYTDFLRQLVLANVRSSHNAKLPAYPLQCIGCHCQNRHWKPALVIPVYGLLLPPHIRSSQASGYPSAPADNIPVQETASISTAIFPVFCHICRESCVAQDFHGYLLIQLIILYKQNVSRTEFISTLLSTIFFFFGIHNRIQTASEF